ncbi:MAG: acyloxyacyl hydrolase [Lentimicrobiaceae bacterium]|nr:acyloxyacyl hydrolase [Lentimicrobiaceae bacterium]
MSGKIRNNILFLSLICCGFHTTAATGNDSTDCKRSFFIEPVVRMGKIIPVHSGLKDLPQLQMYSLEVKIGKQTAGEKDWEYRYRYPRYGVSLRYGHFGEKMFGDKAVVYGFVNRSFLRYKFLSLHYQLGMGVAYWFRCYDSIQNPENRYLGSHLNAYIDLELGVGFRLSPTFDLTLNGAFTHSSNGAAIMPNLGINVLSAHAGLRYHINQRPQTIYPIDSAKSFSPKNSLHFFVAPAFRQSKKSPGTTFGAGTVQLGYMRQFHPKFRFGAGVDFLYSAELQYHLPPEQHSHWKYCSQAAFASFEIVYNRVAAHAALAVYINKSFDFYEFYYERLGVKVFLGKKYNHFVGFSVKAHGGIADYIEWTYGYQFLTWGKKK